jgi:hypothetical protein
LHLVQSQNYLPAYAVCRGPAWGAEDGTLRYCVVLWKSFTAEKCPYALSVGLGLGWVALFARHSSRSIPTKTPLDLSQFSGSRSSSSRTPVHIWRTLFAFSDFLPKRPSSTMWQSIFRRSFTFASHLLSTSWIENGSLLFCITLLQRRAHIHCADSSIIIWYKRSTLCCLFPVSVSQNSASALVRIAPFPGQCHSLCFLLMSSFVSAHICVCPGDSQ